VNRLSQRAGDSNTDDAGFPDLNNRNLSQLWVFENKESAIKVSKFLFFFIFAISVKFDILK